MLLFSNRCKSHNVYVSSADDDLPATPKITLSKDKNGEHNNVVMMNENGDEDNEDGVYYWMVDCIDEATEMIRAGDVWKFEIKKSYQASNDLPTTTIYQSPK